jgi:tetratricopeptide (TPR) repeat protein
VWIDGDTTVSVRPSPDAEIIMGVTALLAPVPIPFAIFSHPRLASADVDGAFRALAEVSLISTGVDDRGNNTFTVHRLVQTIMKERLADAGSCADLGIDLLATRVRDDALWDTCRALAPHALVVLRLEPIEERGQLDAASLSANIGVYFHHIGRYAEARPLLERALAVREKVLGPKHPDTATSLNNLAASLSDQGDYAGARTLHERALANQEEVLGREHPNTAISLSNLAVVLQAHGDYAGARPLLERALAIREKVLGPEHPDTALTLNNLSTLLHDQGDLAAARLFQERALAIREKGLGPEHPDTAQSLNNLALLLSVRPETS